MTEINLSHNRLALCCMGSGGHESRQSIMNSFLGLLFLAVAFVGTAQAGCERSRRYTLIKQSDFTTGTYLIKTPGRYCLVEDVSFNPNSLEYMQANVDRFAHPYNTSDVLPSQYTHRGGPYDPSAFGIGFFAAIAISADGVELDLNGHLLEQSKEHNLQQRFYANIELADRPFISGQGPHSFGALNAAKNVIVKNGRLGRSSHHGIHGNDNENVLLQDLVITDWEVASVALNHVKGLVVERVRAASRNDIPVVGRFSVGRFLRPYINCLVDSGAPYALRVQGQTKTVHDIQEELRHALSRVFHDIVERGEGRINSNKHPAEYALFHNKLGVVDGNAYGFLVNSRGVAVNAFPSMPLTVAASNDVVLSNVVLDRVEADVQEIVGLTNPDQNGIQIDAVGAAFQIFNRHPDTNDLLTLSSEEPLQAEYVGNPVSNAQALVAKAVHEGWFGDHAGGCRAHLDVSRLSIMRDTVDWIEAVPGSGEAKLATLRSHLPDPGYICNGDTMFHVNKGVIGFKLDGAANVTVRNCLARAVVNHGQLGSSICSYDTTQKSHPLALLPGYNGGDARGFTFAGSESVHVKKSTVVNVLSDWGSAIGFDYFGNSKRVFNAHCSVKHAKAGMQANGDPSLFTGPNRVPTASCQRIRDGSHEVLVRRERCKLVSGLTLNTAAGATFVDQSFDTIIN